MDDKELAVEFHKALGRYCRASSSDYRYLTSWGGMPEYDRYYYTCLDGVSEFAEFHNLVWSFGREGDLYFFRLDESLSESISPNKAIMDCLLKYKSINKPQH